MGGQTQNDAPDDIDREDQHAGNGITFHEFRSAIHGTVKISFGGNLRPARFRFLRSNKARVQIGINRHLFTRQGIQRKTGRHFGNTAGTLGDDDQIDDHHDAENENTDDIIATKQQTAKGLDNLPGRISACMAFHQYHAGGSHVQAQPQQGGKQQDSWEA